MVSWKLEVSEKSALMSYEQDRVISSLMCNEQGRMSLITTRWNDYNTAKAILQKTQSEKKWLLFWYGQHLAKVI